MPPLIRIICIGKIKEPYLRAGILEYQKRISRFARLEIIELKDEGMKKEAARIIPYLTEETFILDEAGSGSTSLGFAKLMKDKSPTFIIGGADGIDPGLKSKAPLLSLSPMTFVHEMARLILLEQIYRSFMINNHRRYHR